LSGRDKAVPTAKPQKDMVDLAVQLIEKKSGSFDATKFEDHYGTALKELVQKKMKGHKVVAKEAERPSGGNVVDLMEALKRSVGLDCTRLRRVGRTRLRRVPG
jgi:DNA end-binding protein Ku